MLYNLSPQSYQTKLGVGFTIIVTKKSIYQKYLRLYDLNFNEIIDWILCKIFDDKFIQNYE